ncbi:MAG: acetyl-CoA carboxylase biotin carboxyl carrier protein subunit [Treponema sp.]|jgi:acetyl-CoA carboxylase biotin carboxyl carrier protein|nr:acetyl-CoA carboxylase biotin carboxyl carrier protein subunit [Treponema sp.]
MNDSLILTLLDKFSASSASELDFQDGTARLILKKAGGHEAAPAGLSQERGPPALDAPPVQGESITSPMVATFYASADLAAPPFVSPGSQVKAGDTLCILEAMKMMNRLEADFACEVLAVHAKSGDLVEYGQTLFEVKRIAP